MANIHEPEFVERREQPGFRATRARLGYQLETERLGVSLWELPSGEAAYPFHYHLSEEELRRRSFGTAEPAHAGGLA